MQECYARNLGPLTEQDCLLLQKGRVFLAGCGGLGGYLLEHLLRVGVGTVTVCDGDRFVASNLNRPAAGRHSKSGPVQGGVRM